MVLHGHLTRDGITACARDICSESTMSDPDGPGPCKKCGAPANNHITVEGSDTTLELCPDNGDYTRQKVRVQRVMDTVDRISHAIRDAAQRVGGIPARGNMPPHLAADIAIILMEGRFISTFEEDDSGTDS